MILQQPAQLFSKTIPAFYEKSGCQAILENAKDTVNNFIKSAEEMECEFMRLLLPENFAGNIQPTYFEENY